MSSQLVILSGPPNAGKSQTAIALCQRYDRMLHIDVAVLRNFLRMGRLRPWDTSADGTRQRGLLIESACEMARRFLEAGYGVIIDDIITAIESESYRDALKACTTPVHLIVLLPPMSVIQEREADRASEWGRGDHLTTIYQRFLDWNDVPSIDPNGLSSESVADRVMALAAEGRALLA